MAATLSCRPTLYQLTIVHVELGEARIAKLGIFCCSDPRSRWRLLRSGGLGRRRHADEDPVGRGGFGAQAVHRRLELYWHELPADLEGHHALRHDLRGVRLAEHRPA